MSDFTETLTKIETIENTHERVYVSNFYVSNHLRENDCCVPLEDWEMILYYDYDPWCLIEDITEHWTPELKRKVAKVWWEEFKKINTDDYGQITEPFMFWSEGTDQFNIMEAFKDFFDIDVIEDKDFMGMVGFANGDYLVNTLKRNQEEKERISTPMTSCGRYMNIWNNMGERYMNIWNDMGEYDCYIKFHKAEENNKIDKTIEETKNICHHIMQNKHMETETKKELIDELLSTYTDYGVKVIIIRDKNERR